jgi:hypothetical protein
LRRSPGGNFRAERSTSFRSAQLISIITLHSSIYCPILLLDQITSFGLWTIIRTFTKHCSNGHKCDCGDREPLVETSELRNGVSSFRRSENNLLGIAIATAG